MPRRGYWPWPARWTQASSPQALQYHILHEAYVQRRPEANVLGRYSVGEASCHRNRRAAVSALAHHFQSQEELNGAVGQRQQSKARQDTGLPAELRRRPCFWRNLAVIDSRGSILDGQNGFRVNARQGNLCTEEVIQMASDSEALDRLSTGRQRMQTGDFEGALKCFDESPSTRTI